jgi:uncharacterized protein
MNFPTISGVERRFNPGSVELRSLDEGKSKKVRGYAAVFGKRSQNLGDAKWQFFEIIEKGAFDDVLKDDVRSLFNHDPNLILARSKNGTGTLSLGVDDTGLWYEFEAPDTQAGNDLMESISRGDVDQSSFAFSLLNEGQKWEEVSEGGKTVVVRTIKKVSRLYDVSPVTYPAYPDATVAIRSLEQFKEAAKPQTFPVRSLWAARLGLR